MTLIAISGSQGSGKSTIIQQLKLCGFNTIERKTSRSILAEWGVTIEQINNDNHLTLKFQDEILRRKYEDEGIHEAYQTHNVVESSKIWFTERTYADLMTYFLISLGKTNEFSSDINDYYEKCIKYQQSYSKIFYLRAGHFTPVNDGVRGSNIHYSRMADLTMLDLTQQMTPVEKLTVIDTPCLEQRVNIILAHCGLL
jgi:predicted ATPase